jgi:hypothetical protein
MQLHFNVTIAGVTYGVLVSRNRYGHAFHKARSPFKTVNVNLEDELWTGFNYGPN